MWILKRRQNRLLELLDHYEAEGRDPGEIEDQLDAIRRSQAHIRRIMLFGAPLLGAGLCAGLALGLYAMIHNVAPTPSMDFYPKDCSVSTVISFDGSASEDKDGTIRSFTWHFGDNTPSASGAKVVHTYNAPGSYTVVLGVTDNRGAYAAASKELAIRPPNVLPQPAFRWAPEHPSTQDVVSFDATQSRDTDGRIVSYQWDFGDGTRSQGVSTTHAFGRPGSYSVSLDVVDDRGGKAGLRKQLDVSVPPPPNRQPIAGTIVVLGPTGSDAVVGEGWVSLVALGCSDPDGDALTYAWHSSDGTTASGAVWICYLTKRGHYRVVLTVTDEHGATASTSTTFDY